MAQILTVLHARLKTEVDFQPGVHKVVTHDRTSEANRGYNLDFARANDLPVGRLEDAWICPERSTRSCYLTDNAAATLSFRRHELTEDSADFSVDVRYADPGAVMAVASWTYRGTVVRTDRGWVVRQFYMTAQS